MLERAKETTRNGKYTYVEYACFADDLVVLKDAHPRNAWLLGAVNKRLREELAKLQVEINEEKSRIVDFDCACGNQVYLVSLFGQGSSQKMRSHSRLHPDQR